MSRRKVDLLCPVWLVFRRDATCLTYVFTAQSKRKAMERARDMRRIYRWEAPKPRFCIYRFEAAK